jgi:ataxia telangiectasia mutated family protein
MSRYRYNKGDIPPQEFAGKMRKMRENKLDPSSPSKLTTLFLALRKCFKPVMRHFFTEKHKVPMSWFAMRLNYTRSVATTSIVGHILGLGDRHISNILLDSSTGEVVHIDLGIAFEQVAFPVSFHGCNLTRIVEQGEATHNPGVCPVPHDG